MQHCHLDINVADVEHLFSRELSYCFNLEEQLIIGEEINNLLELKVIEITDRKEEQIISPIFLRPKKNGGYRMVLDLKRINSHIPYKHFKMENFEQAIRLVNAGDYLASVDLRHAYYSVRITPEQQDLLCFKWKDTIYKFTCLPNGVAEGPRIFTKLMKPVFAYLRKRGYSITSFIDDTLICNNSQSSCLACIEDTIVLLQKLGFCVNYEKSVLTPTRNIEYLGNIIDTISMTVSLPARRVEKITDACNRLLRKSKETIREVARVTGLLVAAIPAVEMGKLHYRKVEMEKIAALQVAGGNFDRWMPITEAMKSDLCWWIDNITTQDRKIFRPGTDINLYTDASNIGWGCHLNQRCTGGGWSSGERSLHINALELKAIFLSLQTFSHELVGKHIRVFCDNTTAINYVNEMGGTKSPVCNALATEIWDWCREHSAWITCSHIPGKDNTIADRQSRTFNDRHEWKLNEKVFQLLCGVFGTPVIDLFASRLNKQIATFCSWHPDPEAGYSDAFSINWADFELSYIFPPFSLITRCLQKLRAEGARGWMIVPMWLSQPWMGTLLGMLVDHPRLIAMRRGVLTHPSSNAEHPVMHQTRLMGCLLSGNKSEHEEYLQRVRISSWPHGLQVQKSSTDRILEDGRNFVVGGTLIPLIPMSVT